MQNNTRRRLVLIGLEDAAGNLDGTMMALPVQTGFSIAPEGETKSRDIVRPSMSNIGSSIGAKNWNINCPLELVGGGLTGGAVNNPPMHAALLACGMVQEPGIMLNVTNLSGAPSLLDIGAMITNTTAADNVGYSVYFIAGQGSDAVVWVRGVDQIPAPGDALTLGTLTATAGTYEPSLVYRFESDRDLHRTAVVHAHYDGQRRIASRVQGSMQFEWVAGEFCTVQFAFNGLYNTPANVSIPSAVYADREPPIAESAGLMLGNYPTAQGTIERLTFNVQADVQPVPDINSPNGRRTYRIAGRNPVGTINPESVALADYNPFRSWEIGAKAGITATLGTVAGERISIAIPAPRVTAIADQERAGSDAQQLTFEATGTNDDEFYMIFH